MSRTALLKTKAQLVAALRMVNRELGCASDDEIVDAFHTPPPPVDSVDYALLNAQVAIDRVLALVAAK